MSRLVWHGDIVQKRIESKVQVAMKRIRKSIADKMRGIVPVKTGALKRSITETDRGIEVREEYAGKIEYGTAKTAAKPFTRPAIKQFNEHDLKQSLI